MFNDTTRQDNFIKGMRRGRTRFLYITKNIP